MSSNRQPQVATVPKDGRLTIGLLADDIVMVGGQNALRGVADAALERDVNLLCFHQRVFHKDDQMPMEMGPASWDALAEVVDGLVIYQSWTNEETFAAFRGRFPSLPMANALRVYAGCPGLAPDAYGGTKELTCHLIKVHGYRRIAFVTGPEGNWAVEERYRGYVDGLAEHDVPLDPNLVTPHLGWERGVEAVRLLLDERKLLPGTDFEAVVTSNDTLALGVLDWLQGRGMRIPGDVAVVGFDDDSRAACSTPPLTTTRVPAYEIGRQAVDLVLAQIAGEEVPEQTLVHPKMMVRRSCGCADPLARAAAGPIEWTGAPLEVAWAACRGEILAEMAQAAGALAARVDPDWPDRLLNTFVAALMAPSPESLDLFLRELDDVLRQTMSAGDGLLSSSEQGPEVWHGVVSVLYRHAWPYLDGEALVRGEDLGQQMQEMIAEAARRAQAYRTLQAEWRNQILYEVGEALITTFDVGELMDVLAAQLPRLDIPSCYLALYEDPQPYEYPQPGPEWSWLVLAYSAAEGRRLDGRLDLSSHGRRFRSRELIPEDMWPQGRRYSFLVEPLHFREHQLGFALFEVGPREGTIYSTLRAQISSALHGALLLDGRKQAGAALEKAYAAVEQQVRERTAELERESAERERVQEENLHLQQEVIEAQRRALHELSTPIIPVMELPRGGSVIVVPLIGNIDNMRARDITRQLLVGIREHRAKVIILDVTGVPVVDTGVADHLNKTIQAARLKGARTIVTGISDAVAETIVDLGVDWSGITMLGDLESGLQYVWQESNAT